MKRVEQLFTFEDLPSFNLEHMNEHERIIRALIKAYTSEACYSKLN